MIKNKQKVLQTSKHSQEISEYLLKTIFDVNTVRRWLSRVNCNPREMGETDLSERLYGGRPVATIDEVMVNRLWLSLKLTEKSLMQNSVKPFR